MKKMIALFTALIFFTCSFSVAAGAENTMPFKDVEEGKWYYDAVTDCYRRGVLNGVSADRFDPEGNMTRAMFVQALANHSSTYVKLDTTRKFSDVEPGPWYYDAVQWGASLHIISGFGGRFNPAGTLTRADMAAVLYRYAEKCPGGIQFKNGYDNKLLHRFQDAALIPGYAKEAVLWAVSNEIITGVTADRLAPLAPLTRAQAALVLSKVKDMNAPHVPFAALSTYEYVITFKNEVLLSLQLPESWKEDCTVITYENAETDTVTCRFISKKNHVALGTTGERTGGWLFSVVIEPEFDDKGPDYQLMGNVLHDGKVYDVCAVFPTDVQWLADKENYDEMNRYVRSDIVGTAHFA